MAARVVLGGVVLLALLEERGRIARGRTLGRNRIGARRKRKREAQQRERDVLVHHVRGRYRTPDSFTSTETSKLTTSLNQLEWPWPSLYPTVLQQRSE